MRLRSILSGLFLVAAVHASAQNADFPKAGFSIAPLDTAPGTAPVQLVASFMLPPSGGFAANVNVMLFSNHKTLAEFIETTRREFLGMKAEVSEDKLIDGREWTLEYTATQNIPGAGPTAMRFYSRALFRDGHVYFATATSSAATWDQHKAALKACVDSLRLR